MANPFPIITIHKGITGGNVRARRRPVSAADPSKIVSFRCRIVLTMISNAMADRIETIITERAGIPKKNIPKRLVGSNARIT
jgi:hypothetical protein